MLKLKIMFGAAVLGAGVVGVLTLFAPAIAGQYVFAGATEVDLYLRILGALWLALGAVAILGFSNPMRFAPILLVQLVYKTAWLAIAAYPALIAGERSPGLLFLAVMFSVWVLALTVTIPFRALIAPPLAGQSWR